MMDSQGHRSPRIQVEQVCWLYWQNRNDENGQKTEKTVLSQWKAELIA